MKCLWCAGGDEQGHITGCRFSSSEVIESRIKILESGIRKHRDAKGHDRCFENDLELYKLLPESTKIDNQLPSRAEFLEGCAKYYDGQCH